MSRLWDSGAGLPLDEAVLELTVSDDPELDRELLPYDCLASAAHARMLERIGLLDAQDLGRLIASLGDAYALARDRRFPITREQEDGHTALEAFLVEKTGEAGRRIHTGRSRNDQVIAALRLLVRERLGVVAASSLTVAESLIHRGSQHRATLMPGYTHTRQAMPSTVSHLLWATAEGLLRDQDCLLPALAWADRGALGSASGYGVPLPLDRVGCALDLGLSDLDHNALFVQNTRGKLEALVLFGLHQLALTLARLASDLIWFSSEAFGFFRLPTGLTTGSSIMPQKRNPDGLELVRALPAGLLARYIEATAVLQGLGSGYHRDLQTTKGPLLWGLHRMAAALTVMDRVVTGLVVDQGACQRALDPAILATDQALALVRDGKPFREAYRTVKQGHAPAVPLEAVLGLREHAGAPGQDEAPRLLALLHAARERLSTRPSMAAMEKLLTHPGSASPPL